MLFMPLNLMLLPTLALAASLAWLAYWLWQTPPFLAARRCLLVLAIILAIPGLLIALYYAHVFEPAAWFYEFRSTQFSELSAAGVGLLPGLTFAWLGSRKAKWGISRPRVLFATLVCIALPYAKPMILPPDYSAFRNDWDGVVCRQSTGYSCGPASTATLLHHTATELELARECYTSRQGTENWYLARAVRRRGLYAEFVTSPTLNTIPTHCIAGVSIHGAGHFIAVLQQEGDRYLVGDPMVGEKWYALPELRRAYQFTGFFMRVLK